MTGRRGLDFAEPLIFERGSPGRRGTSTLASPLGTWDASREAPSEFLRRGPVGLPEVGEPEAFRHFVRLSRWNFAIDLGMYPLGSCTMKYNPKVNEAAARMPGFAELHPYAPESWTQGALRLLYELAHGLAELAGLHAVTLQPAAGAQGELTGLMIIRAAHIARGGARTRILIPDTAHGTNPASSALCGFEVVPLPTGGRGFVEASVVERAMDERVAAFMATNPNTLGLFESEIGRIAEIVHAKGGFVYCDGANMNALLGKVRPGDMGVDVMQYNLHKTFTTPHGGGGPGAGPVAVTKALEPFLPKPVVAKTGDVYRFEFDRPKSIGRMRSFCGNFGVLVRAFTYLREMGIDGLTRVAEMAVLNANYLRVNLRDDFQLAFDGPCMHEAVFSDKKQKASGATTMDIAKRLIDFGFHPPTIYFPLVVHGALMIEPTETETKETLDEFIAAMREIARECRESPDVVKGAPHHTALGRLDEVQAARRPVLRWKRECEEKPRPR
ncbi:MAG: aminomethyl-transferring glycine dehydrogenase subunit GcvPB [Deltaproteobacteria bacterium]|nr:aminomethyl-transferring glycine dehydrogenase subunit GcvPB [Deltaproteobacteria bacterium]